MEYTTGIQQGDVALHQTPDGGDFEVTNGITQMTPGLEVAAYISLFGGNAEDDGQVGNPMQYWGNFIENEPSKQIRSRTQYLLRSLPTTSANLRRVEDAAVNDLAWMVTDRVASEVTAVATIPALNAVRIVVSIDAFGEESTFTFTENWQASI